MTPPALDVLRNALKQSLAEHLRHHRLLPEWGMETDDALADLTNLVRTAQAIAAADPEKTFPDLHVALSRVLGEAR